jgi:hypothetical protein
MRGSPGNQTRRTWAELAVVFFGICVVVGGGSEVADWIWGLHLRPRLDSAYQLLSKVHVGMTRAEVKTTLEIPHPPYDKLLDGEQDELIVYVHYSLFEGCYASVSFEQGRVVRLSTSRSSEPGRCPGAPAEWGS